MTTPALEALRRLVEAAHALARFMRSPDTNDDGTPADWTPGLDVIGEFYAAVDADPDGTLLARLTDEAEAGRAQAEDIAVAAVVTLTEGFRRFDELTEGNLRDSVRAIAAALQDEATDE